MRFFAPLVMLLTTTYGRAEQIPLPEAPVPQLLAAATPLAELPGIAYSTSMPEATTDAFTLCPEGYRQDTAAAQAARQSDPPKRRPNMADEPDLDANGNPIPLERHQPKRILGFMPNYRSVRRSQAPPARLEVQLHRRHPPGLRLLLLHLPRHHLSLRRRHQLHPVLGKGVGGFYAYTWRGFLDKTDGTYLGAWFLPSLLHEDTRFYPLGTGHPVVVRALYVISRQGVARTYGGSQTPNIAGLGGKVLTQLISHYYPTGATDFSTLATKFAYSAMRDIGFSSIREFYPDIAAHYVRKHREKVAAQSARDVQQSQAAARAASN